MTLPLLLLILPIAKARGFLFDIFGELSAHHQHFNTAIDIVEESTIKAGKNWKDRCKKEIYNFESLSLEVNYLDPHDLVFAKMIAGREKDLEYVEEMFRCNILSIKKLNFIGIIFCYFELFY